MARKSGKKGRKPARTESAPTAGGPTQATIEVLDDIDAVELRERKNRSSYLQAAVEAAPNIPVGKGIVVNVPEGKTAGQVQTTLYQLLRRRGIIKDAKGHLSVAESADGTKVYVRHLKK